MALILTRDEVAGLLDLSKAVDLTFDVLRQQASGDIVASPPKMVAVPQGALRIVSGALLQSQRIGLRASGALGLASSRGTALLYNSENGDLLSVMAYPFGTLRTGATFGVATQLLARENAHSLGMIGTGRNALNLLSSACLVRPIDNIKIYSRNPERRDKFAKRAQEILGVSVEAVTDAQATARDADIVYVATDSVTPVLQANWLPPGVFVGTMGRPSEIDPSVYLQSDRVIVTHKQHEEEYFDAQQFRHQLLELTRSGKIDWNSVHELSDIIAGKAPGRTSDSETIVFKESQGGYGDIAFADWVYSEAQKKGMGLELDL